MSGFQDGVAHAECVRIVTDPRGSSIGLVQPGVVTVLGVPSLEPIAELGIPGALEDHDVGYVGESGRMAVLSRTASRALLHVVDPAGPTKIGEVVFHSQASIASIAGDRVLVCAGGATSVVDASAPALVATPLPVRGHVTAAGRIVANRFVLAINGVLEEWDAHVRAPTRRLRVGHPLDPIFVGGNAQQLWMVPRGQPEIVDVVALSTRSTRRIELPEPVLRIDAHPGGTWLAVLGARTRSAFVVDIARMIAVRVEAGPISDLAWLGHSQTLVIKPSDAPLELRAIAAPDLGPVRARASTAEPSPPADDEPPVPPVPPVAAPAVASEPSPTRWSRDDISERLAAWRAKHAGSAAAAPTTTADLDGPATAPPAEPPRGWREAVAWWAKAAVAGSEPPPLDGTMLDELARRYQLTDGAARALAFLYGAHLVGKPVSAFDVAGALAWDWTEALGNGAIAAAGLARWHAGRIRLAPEVIALLDERPALHGAVVAGAFARDTAVAIIAPADLDAAQVGAWAAPTIGPLLVPNDRGRRDCRGFVREARVRGVTPLVRWTDVAGVLQVPPQPAAIVVEHAGAATSLRLPVVATWSGAAVGPD